MKKENQFQIIFRIKGVIENSFSFNLKMFQESDPEKTQIRIGIETKATQEKKEFSVGMDILVVDDKGAHVGGLSCEVSFDIQNFAEAIKINPNNTFTTGEVTLITLLGITYSTLRGIMAAKTNYVFIAPLIEPEELYRTYLESIPSELHKRVK